MLPVAVLIPTRDSMSLLPRHMETMRPWLDLAEEVIVVDSLSRDGTVEFLRNNLPAGKTRYHSHPPGLYQSWNHGIQQADARYLYISTVGDGISREGFIHLFETAERFSCDVVVSPPDFVNEQDRPVFLKQWPVHRLVSFFNLSQPVCFEGLAPFICAVSFIPFAILGSSASNLYRTAALQKNPFPTGYGPNGDGAWGVFNSLHVRFGMTPRHVSFFRDHHRPHRVADDTPAPEERMFAASLKIWEETRHRRPDLDAQAARLGLDRLIRAKRNAQLWRSRLIRHRLSPWPWILNPAAWHARMSRNKAQRDCDALLRTMLQSRFSRESESVFCAAESVSSRALR